MNKKEIVRSIADALSEPPAIGLSDVPKVPTLSLRQIGYIVDLFLHFVRKKSLTEIVRFNGFGTFGKTKRKNKIGYDFANKKSIPIYERDVPFFRPCEGFFRGGDE